MSNSSISLIASKYKEKSRGSSYNSSKTNFHYITEEWFSKLECTFASQASAASKGLDFAFILLHCWAEKSIALVVVYCIGMRALFTIDSYRFFYCRIVIIRVLWKNLSTLRILLLSQHVMDSG